MNNAIIYAKRFENLTDGFKELTKFVPNVKEFLDIESMDTVDEASIIDALILKLKENIPITSNPDFPYTYSFKCDMYGVTFDTDKRFSFGWKPMRDENGVVFYMMRVFFPIREIRSTSEHNLMNNGWKENIRNRFVNSRRQNDNRKQQKGNTVKEVATIKGETELVNNEEKESNE